MKEDCFVKWLKVDVYVGQIQYFTKCVTASAVTLSAMKATSSDVFAAAEMLGMLMTVVILHTLALSGAKEKIVNNGMVVLVTDWVFWMTLSIFSYYYLEMRYFAITVMAPVFGTVRSQLFKVIINRNLSGDELTDYNNWSEKLKVISGVAGFSTSYVLIKIGHDVPLGWALVALVVTSTPVLYTDIKIWKTGKDL